MNNQAKEYVFRKFDELKTAIRWDTFNLPRNSQDLIENKLQELFSAINGEYEKLSNPIDEPSEK